MSDRATEAADAVLDELDKRSGFDYWWDDIDSDIQNEIRDTLAKRIDAVYSDSEASDG